MVIIMAPMSGQKPLVTDIPQPPAESLVPELHEREYMSEVLQLYDKNFEAYFESLITRAAALGISLSRPSTAAAAAAAAASASAPDKRNTSSTESSATLDPNHTRFFLTGSGELASTAPTSPTSLTSPLPPSSKEFNFGLTGKVLTRKRSKGLTFSRYENYLAQLDPHFRRSKFNSLSSFETPYAPSIFNASTRRGLFSLKNGLSKIRHRRRSIPSAQVSLMFVLTTACLVP